MTARQTIRILLAEDHALVRQGVVLILDAEPDLEVVAQASDGAEAVALARDREVDLAVLDVAMPRMTGLQAAREISRQRNAPRILMLSMYDNPTYVARSVALGAVDYVLKGSPRDDLISAIQRAAKGEGPAEGSMMERVKDAMARRGDRDDDIPLTNRELQVLRHVALGLSNREIARRLVLSPETVKTHASNLFGKLGANNRTQAVARARELELLE